MRCPDCKDNKSIPVGRYQPLHGPEENCRRCGGTGKVPGYSSEQPDMSKSYAFIINGKRVGIFPKPTTAQEASFKDLAGNHVISVEVDTGVEEGDAVFAPRKTPKPSAVGSSLGLVR